MYVVGTMRIVGASTAILTGNRVAIDDTASRHDGPDGKGSLHDVGFLRSLIDKGSAVNTTTLADVTGEIDIVGQLDVTSTVFHLSGFHPTGGILTAPAFRIGDDQTFAGFGAVSGSVRGGIGSRIVAEGGDLSLGDRSHFTGFITDGDIDTGAHAVELLARGFATLGQVTTLGGGRLSAPGGVVLLGGRAIAGFGTVSARVAGNAGSTIDASGALDLGTANATDGFFS